MNGDAKTESGKTNKVVGSGFYRFVPEWQSDGLIDFPFGEVGVTVYFYKWCGDYRKDKHDDRQESECPGEWGGHGVEQYKDGRGECRRDDN